MKVTLFLALATVLLSVAQSEYLVKVHPPVPQPSPSHIKNKGQRWSGNSLGPPRIHIREPPHHRYSNRPTITVHHHLSHPLKPHVHHAPIHHPHHKGLAHHHHHHHHHPPSIRRPQHPKGPWSARPSPNKDSFNPSPPDSQQAHLVPTHPVVDDNKGPIHTIPAPNLGPSGNSYSGGPFQSGHSISLADTGGPYPNPVYGKPATADLTYQEPIRPEPPIHIPTITLQNSHSYQVHEQSIDTRPQPAVLFAPDPDPSIPAPKVPFTTDPFSHPTIGQSHPDLEQDIPQHLFSIYGNQDERDLGERLLLAQALAQYDVQTIPESYHQQPLQQIPTAVSVPSLPFVAPVHETVYPVSLPSGSQDVQGGQLSMYDLISKSPIQSPILEALREDYPSSTPSSVTSYQYSVPQQFHSSTVSPINFSYEHQQLQNQQITAEAVQPNQGHQFAYQQLQNQQITAEAVQPNQDHQFAYQQLQNQQITAEAVQPNQDHQFAYHQILQSTTVAPPTGQLYTYSTVPESAATSNFQEQHYVSTTNSPPQSGFKGSHYVSDYASTQNNFGKLFETSKTAVSDPSYALQGQHVNVNPSPQVSSLAPQYQFHLDNSHVKSGVSDNTLQNLGYLGNHQVEGVSISNPGQAGYISASYHHQRQTSNTQATSASENSKTISTIIGEKVSDSHSANRLDSPPRKEAPLKEENETSEIYYDDWQEENESSTGSSLQHDDEYDEEEYKEGDEGNVEQEYDRNVEFGTRLNPK